MNTYNNSLGFYKTYYDDINWGADEKDSDNKKEFERKNQKITQSKLIDVEELPLVKFCKEEDAIELVTVYPGLLMGSGITHGSGREGEIKIGFYFDHTTGLPIIPGSSVKGTLRSVFPMDYLKNAKKEDKDEEKSILEAKAKACKEYLKNEINKIVKETGQTWSADHIETLERWLFGDNEAGKESQVAMSDRIVFYDAYPIRMLKGDNLPCLGLDFITPHSDPLKNPIPIQFLKVMPGLVYRFQFRWTRYVDEKNNLELTVKDLQTLFTVILKDIGIGAKTNVGYGQLLSIKEYLDNYGGEDQNVSSHAQSLDIGLAAEVSFSQSDEPQRYHIPPRCGDTIKLPVQIKAGRNDDDFRRIVFHTDPPNMIKGMKDKKGRFKDVETDGYSTATVRIRKDRRDEVDEIIEPKIKK